jgi:hypothetical protein
MLLLKTIRCVSIAYWKYIIKGKSGQLLKMNNEILIHALKAVNYRFIKATDGSKENFGSFKISAHTRSPSEIVNHMFDLVTKTQSMISEGHFNTTPPAVLDFTDECHRFVAALDALQSLMSETEIDIEVSKKLLQGPILDIASHIGQIAMLNGLKDNKISKVSYYSADL